MLEPRRVTARLPALALREICGPLVGYQIRLESLWDKKETRVGYLTYGTALRLFFQSPPGEDELVVFDEFHERSWEAEVLLAFLRSRKSAPRILLMSATLDRSSLPQEVPVLESDGRLHEVSLSWEVKDPQLAGRRDRLATLCAERSVEWAARNRGEQLIFLPGLAEIRAVQEILSADPIGGPVEVLHSTLPEQEIRRVVERPPGAGFRRILSTDLAESSVTLPGVTVVLDAGLIRRPIRDALDLGITLKTEGAPLSALVQRAGRAGRVANGHCHRLFTKAQQLHRPPFPRPEIEQADIRTVALVLASQGLLSDWQSLPWLSPPCPEGINEATAWSREQGLLTSQARLTERGREVLSLPLEARVANFASLARRSGHSVTDVVSLALSLDSPPGEGGTHHLAAWNQISQKRRRTDRRLESRLTTALSPIAPQRADSLEQVLVGCYSDTLAQVTAERAVCAHPEQPALAVDLERGTAPFFAVLLSASPRGGQGPRSYVNLLAEVSLDTVWETLLEQLEEKREFVYDRSTRSVRIHTTVSLRSLVLERTKAAAPRGPETARLLREHLSEEELPYEYHQFRQRMALFLEHRPEWRGQLGEPFSSAEDPAESLLLSFLETVSGWKKDSGESLMQHLRGVLPYTFWQELERELPAWANFPHRRKPVPIQFPPDESPYVASKLQDFFGWTPPRLLGGKVPLVCHLLAPNGRACQITEDLTSFWSGSYKQVRKDLRGRYPRHDWPEDPGNLSH